MQPYSITLLILIYSVCYLWSPYILSQWGKHLLCCLVFHAVRTLQFTYPFFCGWACWKLWTMLCDQGLFCSVPLLPHLLLHILPPHSLCFSHKGLLSLLQSAGRHAPWLWVHIASIAWQSPALEIWCLPPQTSSAFSRCPLLDAFSSQLFSVLTLSVCPLSSPCFFFFLQSSQLPQVIPDMSPSCVLSVLHTSLSHPGDMGSADCSCHLHSTNIEPAEGDSPRNIY